MSSRKIYLIVEKYYVKYAREGLTEWSKQKTCA